MNNNSTCDTLELLSNICHSNLKNSKKILKYLLKDRKIDSSLIKKYRIGYFPQNIEKLTNYVDQNHLMKFNIAETPYRSQFSDYFSLVFPIYSEYGDAVGISGRSLLSDIERRSIGIPKYKNSSYKKANILYGLNHAVESIVEKQNVYVLEGYFDKISMDSVGIDNSVAICGTAFSQNHFLKLMRYTNKITFILDSDDAGVKSMQRIYERYINKGTKLRFLKIPPPFKDIDEFFLDNNADDFEKNFKQIIPGEW